MLLIYYHISPYQPASCFQASSPILLQPSLNIHLCRQLQHTARAKSCQHSSRTIPRSRLQASRCGFSGVWLKQRKCMLMCASVHTHTHLEEHTSLLLERPRAEGGLCLSSLSFSCLLLSTPLRFALSVRLHCFQLQYVPLLASLWGRNTHCSARW